MVDSRINENEMADEIIKQYVARSMRKERTKEEWRAAYLRQKERERQRKLAEEKRRAEEAEEERVRKEEKAKGELRWMWGGFAVFFVAWMVYGLWCDVPVVIAVVLSLVGGWGCVFIVIMSVLLAKDIINGNTGGSDFSLNIPAPSKQTQRMLKRNIRRRWF